MNKLRPAMPIILAAFVIVAMLATYPLFMTLSGVFRSLVSAYGITLGPHLRLLVRLADVSVPNPLWTTLWLTFFTPFISIVFTVFFCWVFVLTNTPL